MEVIGGGGKWGCGFAVVGALVTTPVGAVDTTAGYSIAIPSLAGCFSDKF